jgi:hypothetical protein
MGMITSYEGKFYEIPFDFTGWLRRVNANFGTARRLRIDERDLAAYLGQHAEWVTGSGQFLLVSCCKGRMTITRWHTFRKASAAKDHIDRTGCGGFCARIHFIAETDPKNTVYAQQQRELAAYIAEHEPQPVVEHKPGTQPMTQFYRTSQTSVTCASSNREGSRVLSCPFVLRARVIAIRDGCHGQSYLPPVPPRHPTQGGKERPNARFDTASRERMNDHARQGRSSDTLRTRMGRLRADLDL